jgi:hypothetical protein
LTAPAGVPKKNLMALTREDLLEAMRWSVEKLGEDIQNCQKVVEDYTSASSVMNDLENSIRAHYVRKSHKAA